MQAIFRSKSLMSIMTLEIVLIAAYVIMKMSHRMGYIFVVLYAVFLGIVVRAGIRMRRKYGKVPEWWLFYKHTGRFLRGFLAVCVIVIAMYGVVLFGDSIRHSFQKNTVTNAENEMCVVKNRGESILENMELLHDLQPENYSELDAQELANALYRVVQIEAEYLGIETPDLQIVHLAAGIVSQYGTEDNIIRVNEAYLCCEETVLNGILHEMYHAYQYACVCQVDEGGELLFFRQVEEWREEFATKNPNTRSAEGYLEYYVQKIEIMARAYAEERIGDYEKLLVLENH